MGGKTRKTAIQTTLSSGSTVKREKNKALSCGIEGVIFFKMKEICTYLKADGNKPLMKARLKTAERRKQLMTKMLKMQEAR